MAHDWFLLLDGDPSDLNRLMQAFPPGAPVSITNGERDQYRLREERLNDVDDEETVRTELEATLTRLNALARLRPESDYLGVASGGIGEMKPGGAVDWFDSATVVLRTRVSGTKIFIGRDGQTVPPPADPLPGWLQLAMSEVDVDDALYFLRRPDPSWGELYKAFEIVRSDVGRIDGSGWASKSELTRFTRTANHQAAAGRDARHARMSQAPPSDPMTLKEGRVLIRRIVAAWIAAKLPPAL